MVSCTLQLGSHQVLRDSAACKHVWAGKCSSEGDLTNQGNKESDQGPVDKAYTLDADIEAAPAVDASKGGGSAEETKDIKPNKIGKEWDRYPDRSN